MAKTTAPALTDAQKGAAAILRQNRPEVLPGTNVIFRKKEADKWHNDVTSTLRALEVNPRRVGEFCDLAGVAD